MKKFTSKIWAGIEEKSQQWHKVMMAELEKYEDKNSCAKKESLGLAQIAECLFPGDMQKLRLFMLEKRDLLLNAREMTEIDNLGVCRCLHSAVTVALDMICRDRCDTTASAAEGNYLLNLVASKEVWGCFYSDWRAEIYVKHPVLRLDYPVLLQRGVFFVRFDADFPSQVKWWQYCAEADVPETNTKKHCPFM